MNLLLCRRRKENLKGINPHTDPLVRLQYIARLGWQYDLADVAALLATPTIVSFLVFRDGFFTIQYSGILVLPCHLRNVWIRFAILLVIKPGASWLARTWLRMRMVKCFLGKKTLHGTSRIAAKIMAERKLVSHGNDSNLDSKVLEAFSKDFTEDEIKAVQDEFSLQGLNFKILRYKLMKKWRYYLAVVVLQLFAAFQCRRNVPLLGIGNETHVPFEPVAMSSTWAYVPFGLARLEDPMLRARDLEVDTQNCSSDAISSWPLPYEFDFDRSVKEYGPMLIVFGESTTGNATLAG